MQNNKLNQKSKALAQNVWRRRAKPTKKICRTALIENRFCTSAQAADSVTKIAAGKQDEQATKKNVQIMITHAFGRVLSVLAIMLFAALALLPNTVFALLPRPPTPSQKSPPANKMNKPPKRMFK